MVGARNRLFVKHFLVLTKNSFVFGRSQEKNSWLSCSPHYLDASTKNWATRWHAREEEIGGIFEFLASLTESNMS